VPAECPVNVHFNRKTGTESLEKKFLKKERERIRPPLIPAGI
jgi:hypothetical protein